MLNTTEDGPRVLSAAIASSASSDVADLHRQRDGRSRQFWRDHRDESKACRRAAVAAPQRVVYPERGPDVSRGISPQTTTPRSTLIPKITCGCIIGSMQMNGLDETPTCHRAAATTKSREGRTREARGVGTTARGKCVISSDVGTVAKTCGTPGLVMIPIRWRRSGRRCRTGPDDRSPLTSGSSTWRATQGAVTANRMSPMPAGSAQRAGIWPRTISTRKTMPTSRHRCKANQVACPSTGDARTSSRPRRRQWRRAPRRGMPTGGTLPRRGEDGEERGGRGREEEEGEREEDNGPPPTQFTSASQVRLATVPVMAPARSEARNAAASATSARVGWCFSIPARRPRISRGCRGDNKQKCRANHREPPARSFVHPGAVLCAPLSERYPIPVRIQRRNAHTKRILLGFSLHERDTLRSQPRRSRRVTRASLRTRPQQDFGLLVAERDRQEPTLRPGVVRALLESEHLRVEVERLVLVLHELRGVHDPAEHLRIPSQAVVGRLVGRCPR